MKKIALFLLVVIITSCSRKHQVTFNPSFGNELKTDFISSSIIKSDMDCRYPIKLALLDSIFVVQDLGGDKLIQLYDLSGNYLSCLVKQGDAPNEIPNLTSTFSVENNKIVVYSTPKIAEYDPFKYLNAEKDFCFSHKVSDKLFSLPVHCVRKFNDSYFLEGSTDQMRFALFDKDSSLYVYKEYPQIIANASSEKIAQVMSYASKIAFSPDKRYWIQGSYIGGTLEIFQRENNEIASIKQIFIYPPVFEDMGAMVSWGNDTTIGVDDMYATSNYIYIVLNGTQGANLKSASPVDPFSNKIMVLDWQGNLVRKIETDCMIMALTVDPTDQFCHVVSFEAENGYALRKISL